MKISFSILILSILGILFFSCWEKVSTPFPSIDIVKYTNGLDADSLTGPQIIRGTAVRWDYIITNTGDVTLTDISVDDDMEGYIGDLSSLDPGESRTLNRAGIAGLGLYKNMATAQGHFYQETVSDQDSSHYTGNPPPAASINVEKYTNGQDADSPTGPALMESTMVYWDYTVTNTGNVTLTDISVDDDMEGHIGDIVSLEPGASSNLSHSGTASPGQYMNLATVQGRYNQETVTDRDSSHYFGTSLPAPSIHIEKRTNGQDVEFPTGPSIVRGTPVIWDYLIINTGNVELTNLTVDDDTEGRIGEIPSLNPGATWTLNHTDTADLGQYANQATAIGYFGQMIAMDQDISYYLGILPPPSLKGLIVYYPFNGDADDESGHGNDGIVFGAEPADDRFGNETATYSFDGNTQYISVPDEMFGPDIQGFTLSCWIKLGEGMPDGTSRRIFHKGTVNGEMNLWTGLGSDIAFVTVAENNWFYAESSFEGEWVHIVGLYSRGQYIQIWINGELGQYKVIPEYDLFTAPWTRASVGSTNRGESDFWKGVIDDIRIYNRVISEDEIDALYHEGGW